MATELVIIDYGSGNLRSAAKAFERASAEAGLDISVAVTGDPERVAKADRVVLPGVGAFADCKAGLMAVPGMVEALKHAVHERAVPFFGICVGMQLMAERGLEHGTTEGLGWIGGEVVAIAPADRSLKVPHMGWNGLEFAPGAHPLLNGITPGADCYFVHGYHFAVADTADRVATVDYGGPLTAVIARDNMVGTQFHPEKSQLVGLTIITNFLRWSP